MNIAKRYLEKEGPRFREDEAILFANLRGSKNVTPADPHL